jgi:DNA repair protein RadC
MQLALLCNAKSIIAHNHPSGELMPSSNDLAATHKISQACKLLEMSLTDSFIVTENDCLSLREERQSDLFVD